MAKFSKIILGDLISLIYKDMKSSFESKEEESSMIKCFRECKTLDDIIRVLDDYGYSSHRGEAQDYLLALLVNSDDFDQ